MDHLQGVQRMGESGESSGWPRWASYPFYTRMKMDQWWIRWREHCRRGNGRGGGLGAYKWGDYRVVLWGAWMVPTRLMSIWWWWWRALCSWWRLEGSPMWIPHGLAKGFLFFWPNFSDFQILVTVHLLSSASQCVEAASWINPLMHSLHWSSPKDI